MLCAHVLRGWMFQGLRDVAVAAAQFGGSTWTAHVHLRLVVPRVPPARACARRKRRETGKETVARGGACEKIRTVFDDGTDGRSDDAVSLSPSVIKIRRDGTTDVSGGEGGESIVRETVDDFH